METKELPQADKSDAAYTLLVAGLNAIPAVGGSLATFFSAAISSPLQKRRDAWLKDLLEQLNALSTQNEKITLKNLLEDENFVTAVTQAAQIAIKNHESEKLEALRNGVVHVAEKTVEENKYLMFLNLVDFLTPWHLKLLRLFHDPSEASSSFYSRGSISQLIDDNFVELQNNEEFKTLLVFDLYNRGLSKVSPDMINTMMTKEGVYTPRTTKFGEQFLRFIATPK